MGKTTRRPGASGTIDSGGTREKEKDMSGKNPVGSRDALQIGPMSRELAAHTKARYVCAGCWSELIIRPDPENKRMDLVTCPNCTCPGYITKRWVERKKSESAAEAITVRENLRSAAPFLSPSAGRKVSELLAELGY